MKSRAHPSYSEWTSVSPRRGGSWDARRPPSWRRAGPGMIAPAPSPKKARFLVAAVAAVGAGIAIGVFAARLAGLL